MPHSGGLCWTLVIRLFVTIIVSTSVCFGWPSSNGSAPHRHHQGKTRLHEKTLEVNAMAPAIIANFRQAACLSNVFRCASTDGLGGGKLVDASNLSSSDRFIFEQAGLILDLRSSSERNEPEAQTWMRRAEVKVVEIDQVYQSPTKDRCVVRIDVLSPKRFMKYIEDHWLSSAEQAQASWFKIVDGGKLHELRIEKLNGRGLAGLNEAILETGKEELRRALQTMTEHMEANPDHPVVIHCVQGKDRTGMLVMLLQSLLGVIDDEVVADYFRSNAMLLAAKGDKEGSMAANEIRPKGKLDRNFFSGTNEQAMITTLDFLRSKYGSVSPGYLEAIGFDETWRRRLTVVLTAADELPTSRL